MHWREGDKLERGMCIGERGGYTGESRVHWGEGGILEKERIIWERGNY